MKKTLLYALTALLTMAGAITAQAQCVPVITPGSMILCPNETDTLWSDVHDTYQWLQDGNIIAGATDQFLVVDANTMGGSMISVVTTTTGCPNATDTSDEIFIDGWMFLLPFVIHESPDDHICGGQDSVIFDFSYNASVQWYLNGAPIPGANNDTLIAFAPGLYTAEGAPDVCPNYVLQLGLDLEVTETPLPVITPDSQAICPGTMVTLGTGAYDSYQWYIDGNPIMNSNIPTFLTANEGHYHVQITDGTCTLFSDSAFVWEHTPITPVISLSGNDLVSTPGGSLLSNFQWYLNGVAIPGANDSTYTPTASGDYTVSASDGTCEDTSAAFQHTVSVNDVKVNISFKLYPNPTQGDIYINSAEAVTVILLDNVGRVVYSNAVAGKEHRLTLSRLAKGIYTVKLTGENGSAYEKIILE